MVELRQIGYRMDYYPSLIHSCHLPLTIRSSTNRRRTVSEGSCEKVLHQVGGLGSRAQPPLMRGVYIRRGNLQPS
jgi:hypothetical protein